MSKVESEKFKVLEQFEQMVRENRDVVVAIGETGFDHHYLDGTDGGNITIDMDALSPRAIEQIENQKRWWLAQWELAKRYDLPLVIHTRDARDATAEFMIEHGINRAVIHCYSEDPLFAQRLMDFSPEIYFAFGGILTYKKSETVQATAQMLPLNRILLETDAPFLSPQAVRGTVNEPANTRYILEKLIELRTESAEEIERVVYDNSLRFYGIE
jgi:TatD DNase family protein